MRTPQLVVYEREGFLAWQLEPVVAEMRWLVRQARQPRPCLALVRQHRPTLLVIEVDRSAGKELSLLADVQSYCPDVPVVAVGDLRRKDRQGIEERIRLTRALIDLGAVYVTFPPLSRELLCTVVRQLLQTHIRRLTMLAPTEEADADS